MKRDSDTCHISSPQPRAREGRIAIKGFWWMLVGVILLAVYYFIDPAGKGWMPQCVFHKITGLQCMGCGTQRMFHALLHGQFSEAFNYNAFVFCSLPFIAFLIVLEFNRLRWPALYRRVHSLPVIITSAAMLGAWLLVRNIIGM